jgi:hypothetical protein
MALTKSVRTSLTLVALSIAVAGCNGDFGSRCDDFDQHACNQPAMLPHYVPPADGTQPDPTTLVVHYLSDLRIDPATSRPPQNVAVDVRNLSIVAIDSYLEPGTSGKTGNVWVEEYVSPDYVQATNFQGCAPLPNGGRMCGIELYSSTFVPAGNHPLLGDVVNVSGGTYEEFTCATCNHGNSPFDPGHSLPEIGTPNVTRIGSATPPAPVPVSLSDLMSHGDDYIGVVVQLTDDVTLGLDPRGNLLIATGITVSNELSPLVDPSGAPLDSNVRVHNLTGIVDYFYGLHLAPRSAADMTVVQ